MTWTESLNKDSLLRILDGLADGIYISDEQGTTLWVNSASARICGIPREELIGKSVFELEKTGIYSPSATRKVLEEKKTISVVQTMRNGRKYLVTGTPVLDPHGNVELVVANSRDITEAMHVNHQLDEMEDLVRYYSHELRKMRFSGEFSNFDLVPGKSQSFRRLLEVITKIADIDSTVLITGESGVGKNIIAKRIHLMSGRHDQPFVQVNCTSIPESLFESELFGYKKGAFTGAHPHGKVGQVQLAHGGTLFLDEIGEIPPNVQAKLLNLLQEKQFLPIGGEKPVTVDVRIIAATNRDLRQMVREGSFRQDLYYRLSIIPIYIPSLRERREDILPLIEHFVERTNKKYGLSKRLAPDALKMLLEYPWPGNVRELENLIERLIVLSEDKTIHVKDLPPEITRLSNHIGGHIPPNHPLKQAIEDLEKDYVLWAYNFYKSTRKAANALGISQSSLVRRLKKYGVSGTDLA